MGILGVNSNADADNAKRTVFYSKFAASDTWENVKDFTYSTGGSTRIPVGSRGILTNAVVTDDYVYLFSQDSCYKTAVSEVSLTSGASPADFFAPYGCVNQYCAVNMADAVITFDGKRVIRYRKNISSGQLEADKTFDWAIGKHLENADADQSDAVMFYYEAKQLLFLECNIAGVRVRFVRDNTPIFDREGVLITEGRWLPPDTNVNNIGYFEINGSCYTTDRTDDTIYEIEKGYTDTDGDSGTNIDCVIASGITRLEKDWITADYKDLFVSGAGTSGSIIYLQPIIGGSETTVKEIAPASIVTGDEIASGVPGEEVPGGEGASDEFIQFDVCKPPYPSKGNSFKFISYCSGDGHAFKVDAWKVLAKAYSNSHITRT
jgi:hypothetical protein